MFKILMVPGAGGFGPTSMLYSVATELVRFNKKISITFLVERGSNSLEFLNSCNQKFDYKTIGVGESQWEYGTYFLKKLEEIKPSCIIAAMNYKSVVYSKLAGYVAFLIDHLQNCISNIEQSAALQNLSRIILPLYEERTPAERIDFNTYVRKRVLYRKDIYFDERLKERVITIEKEIFAKWGGDIIWYANVLADLVFIPSVIPIRFPDELLKIRAKIWKTEPKLPSVGVYKIGALVKESYRKFAKIDLEKRKIMHRDFLEKYGLNENFKIVTIKFGGAHTYDNVFLKSFFRVLLGSIGFLRRRKNFTEPIAIFVLGKDADVMKKELERSEKFRNLCEKWNLSFIFPGIISDEDVFSIDVCTDVFIQKPTYTTLMEAKALGSKVILLPAATAGFQLIEHSYNIAQCSLYKIAEVFVKKPKDWWRKFEDISVEDKGKVIGAAGRSMIYTLSSELAEWLYEGFTKRYKPVYVGTEKVAKAIIETLAFYKKAGLLNGDMLKS